MAESGLTESTVSTTSSLFIPMQRYYDCSDKSNPRIESIMQDPKHEYIASEKFDGEAAMIFYQNNTCTILSRLNHEFTDKVPHLVQEVCEKCPNDSIFLAELCINDGSNQPARQERSSCDVSSILRSYPERAIRLQATRGLLVGMVFDCIRWNGTDLMNEPYEKRIKVAQGIDWTYFHPTTWVMDHFSSFLERILSEGGEGIVLVHRAYPYSPGKRTAWKTLKMKRRTEPYELRVIRTESYKRVYKGKCLDSWKYWEGDTPVTRGWYNKWAASIICDMNGTELRCSSGLNDEDRAQLMTPEMQRAINDGIVYAQVRAMQVTNHASLRHPVVLGIRLYDPNM